MNAKQTPQKWISNSLKCKKCGSALMMYEYGDWGHCMNKDCGFRFAMFLGKPEGVEHYQGEESIK